MAWHRASEGPGPAAAAGRLARPTFAAGTALALALLAASVAFAVTLGPADLSVADVWTVIGAKLGLVRAELSLVREGIVWELRLPRTLLAAIVGAGLAVSGAILQSLFRNPLADPYLLGISSGASTGAVAVLVLGLGGGALTLSGGAFGGAILAFALILALGGGMRGSTARMILAGLAGTQFFSAATSLVIILSADSEQTRGALYWLLGSLGGARWQDVRISAAVLACALAVFLHRAPSLDAFAFGDDAAASLGVAVARFRFAMLVGTAFLTAVLVAASGAIGFVGLTIPHAARLLAGPRHRGLLVVSAIMGALFLVWVDAVGRTVFAPREVPVGVLTALVGVPAFALILLRRSGLR